MAKLQSGMFGPCTQNFSVPGISSLKMFQIAELENTSDTDLGRVTASQSRRYQGHNPTLCWSRPASRKLGAFRKTGVSRSNKLYDEIKVTLFQVYLVNYKLNVCEPLAKVVFPSFQKLNVPNSPQFQRSALAKVHCVSRECLFPPRYRLICPKTMLLRHLAKCSQRFFLQKRNNCSKPLQEAVKQKST